MIISLKLNFLTPQLNVNCFAGSIQIATKVKYLGVKIDNKLNFKASINFVEINLLICWYFGKTQILFRLHLYYALTHFHINYGLIIWGNTYSSYLQD